MELTNIFAQLVKAHLVGDVAAARFAHSDIIHHTLDQRSAQNVHERAGRYPPDRATVPIPREIVSPAKTRRNASLDEAASSFILGGVSERHGYFQQKGLTL